MAFDFSALAPQTPNQDPQAMVRQVAQDAGYNLVENADSWQVTVPIGTLRKQNVVVRFDQKDPQGHPLVTYSSICGQANDQNALTLLRYNTKMVHGAFAVDKSGETEVLVIQANHLANMLSVVGVSQVLAAIAFQADQVEQQLLGTDTF